MRRRERTRGRGRSHRGRRAIGSERRRTRLLTGGGTLRRRGRGLGSPLWRTERGRSSRGRRKPAADPGQGAQAAGDDDLVYADVDLMFF